MVEAGRLIGGYRVTDVLGRGGMGVVYRAEDPRLGRDVALKVVAPEISADPEFRERFLQESRIAASLEHPNVLPVFGAGDDDGTLYLAMRLAVGSDLKALLVRDGRLEIGRAAALIGQVGHALQAAHDRGLVHRDVKPANVLVTDTAEGEHAYLTDFGLAKLAGTQHSLTGTGGIVGTIDYMAPEQIRGESIQPAVDIYALACLLYHCLTGRPPFEGDVTAVLWGHLEVAAPDLAERRPDAPAGLAAVVRRAMAKAPEMRFPSAADFVAHLAHAVAPGEPVLSAARPLTGSAESISQLPVPATQILGRESEIETLSHLLLDDDVRLLTLTGPGGVGKTRLALALAHVLADQVDVAFVELAPVVDESLVPAAVAGALGVRESGAGSTLEFVADALRGVAAFVLVLDNAEHVIGGVQHTAAGLLQACPGLRLLVTSRHALRLTAEEEHVVDPLAEDDAARLFTARVRSSGPRGEPDEATQRIVHEVCRRLDCLPLAIELAAARSRLLDPAALLERLDDRLGLLAGGASDVPSRHQTLRATLDWSHSLLEDPDKRALGAMAVCIGGTTVSAAEHVIGTPDSLTRVERLHDASLIRRVVDGGEFRLRMLETVREYAIEMADPPSLAQARARHADYFRALVAQAAGEMHGAEQDVWFVRLDRELDNLRAALDHLLSGAHPEHALEMVAPLAWFWYAGGYLEEGRRWIMTALDMCGEDAPARARALVGLGTIARDQGDVEDAEAAFVAARQAARGSSDRHVEALATDGLGVITALHGDLNGAITLFEQSLALFDESGNLSRSGETLSNMGVTYRYKGDLEAAADAFERSLSTARSMQDAYCEALVLENYGELMILKGEYDRATELLRDALRLDPVNRSRLLITNYTTLAIAELRRGQIDECAACLLQALDRGGTLGSAYHLSRIARVSTVVAAARGNMVDAIALEAWSDSERIRLGVAEVDYAELPSRQAFDHGIAVLDPDAGEAARLRGAGLSAEDAIALVKAVLSTQRAPSGTAV